ncbi:GroES-like protein [Lentilactobacillus kisonensis DSM 19906 = JCM 15041]|uniref:GroES-like protein n=3 Tax=Lentilactobacillus kisonensis TaxID=481722 RepID=A0A0R1NPC6_9LACO|nr:GroES-like protein [Lentilactobacillus kisonensis DSM 19906 = JCM 15041]
MTQQMKAAVINRYGQLMPEITDVAIPQVGDQDILVKIMAASVNPIDLKTQAGQLRMLLHYQMPLILGNDFAGVVTKVGVGVSGFQIGDQVYGRVPKDRIGTFAEYIAVDEDAVALKPTNLTFEQAAAIPLVGLTSYQALIDIMQIKPNNKVLIQAGSGGIGTFAIQLAKLKGAFVATTTSAKNSDFVRQLGADQVIDYHQENFAEVLRDYDDVFDTLGGEAVAEAFKIVKPGGRIVSLSGMPDDRFAKAYGLPRWKQWLFRLVTQKIHRLEKQTGARYHFLFMKPSGRQLTELTSLIEQTKLRPVIDRTFSLAEIQAAFKYSQSHRAKGKIIIKIDDSVA